MSRLQGNPEWEKLPRQLVYQIAAGGYFVRLYYLDCPGSEVHDTYYLIWRLPNPPDYPLAGRSYIINVDEVIERFMAYKDLLQRFAPHAVVETGIGFDNPGTDPVTRRY